MRHYYNTTNGIYTKPTDQVYVRLPEDEPKVEAMIGQTFLLKDILEAASKRRQALFLLVCPDLTGSTKAVLDDVYLRFSPAMLDAFKDPDTHKVFYETLEVYIQE